MIRSMTGFASVTREDERATIAVTVRALNHRHLDIQLRLPHSLAAIEGELRSLIGKHVSRGRVELAVSLQMRQMPGVEVEFNVEFATALEAARQFWHDPLAAPVGQYHYSTHGYTIFGAALEQATGEPVGTLLEKHLASPHELATLNIEDRSVVVPERVTHYRLAVSGEVASGNIAITPDDISWKALGGGLECSALDLLRFGIRLSEGRVISAASLARLTTRIEPEESYAIGCDQFTEQGLNVFTKSGGQAGVSSYIWCVPDQRLVMVVVTNRQDEGGSPALGDALRQMVLADGANTDN